MKQNYARIKCILLLSVIAISAMAQNVELLGVKNTMRYDDGDDTKYEYLGWNYETGKAETRGDVGLWSLNVGTSNVASSLVHYDNLMYGNSGSLYLNGIIYTIMSHEDPDAATDGVMEFVVRKWDAETKALISSQRFPKSANLESRGMCYNPVDGKVYGLFYITDASLPEIDGYVPDQDDIDMGQTGDAGYALCTIDLETMKLNVITPGLYYENFVTLACSPQGRIFSMISSGNLCEFDTETGLLVQQGTEMYEGEEIPVYFKENCGFHSQFKRQAACFDYNTGKMYWNGYVNSGKGYNDWGSYGPLSDREWRTNGKYDTALYEINLETGKATKIANIPNRIAFSCLWVKDGDASDIVTPTGVNTVKNTSSDTFRVYNAQGMFVGDKLQNLGRGLYIVNGKKIIK